jgi:plastocyanin
MNKPHVRTSVNTKRLSIVAGLLIVLIAATGVVFAPDSQTNTGREITIVAKDMTFLLTAPTSTAQANPTITVKARQKITMVLRNDDPGMQHDLVIQGQEIRTLVISYGETTRLTFTAPREPGTYVYMCSSHPISMRGTFLVE